MLLKGYGRGLTKLAPRRVLAVASTVPRRCPLEEQSTSSNHTPLGYISPLGKVVCYFPERCCETVKSGSRNALTVDLVGIGTGDSLKRDFSTTRRAAL